MKYTWLNLTIFFSIFFALIATTETYAITVIEEFTVHGLFERCDVSDDAQKSEAERNMRKNAQNKCGNAVAVQTSKTIFEEAGACIHYERGQIATASFYCE